MLGVRKVNEMATLMGLIVDGSVWGFGASEAGALEDAVRQGHAWVRHARPTYRQLTIAQAKRVVDAGGPVFTHRLDEPPDRAERKRAELRKRLGV